KREAKAAALTRAALHLDSRAMRRANRLHDRKSETGTALGLVTGARACHVHAEEALEQVRQRLGRDADAAITHLEQPAARLRLAPEDHAAPAWRELDGIVEQVDDHLLETAAIAAHRQRLQARGIELQAAVLRQQSHL